VRDLYAEELAERGAVSAEEAEELVAQVHARMKEAHDHLKDVIANGGPQAQRERRPGRASGEEPETALPLERLDELNRQLLSVPDGFTVHPKLMRQLDRRLDALGD
jgi:2-oxoglutarate dehydrogenase E1 component